MVKEVGVVGDNGVVAMGTKEITRVDRVLEFIGVNENAINHASMHYS